ncbi:MAG: SDR family oxidoreductase [Owenweeksia sp.]
MRILLTGANGYIGLRLLPALVEEGHEVVCCVRDRKRLDIKPAYRDKVEVFEVDYLKEINYNEAPKEVDVAFYLIHSMTSSGDFESMEERAARSFVNFVDHLKARQIIYLSGIINEQKLSRHLRSRLNVEEVLKTARAHYTVLRAGIIVGSGSASFEIIRDLVEKLPVMIAPKWLNTLCQPIAIRNVILYLQGVMGNKECYEKVFDIGGKEVLTYKQMLLQFAEVRGLKRHIFTVPVMTPRLSSYWLFFVTSTSYKLAVNLVNSMKIDVVAKNDTIKSIVDIQLFTYKEAVELAFDKIEQNLVVSSWKDAMNSSLPKISQHIEVPQKGVFRDDRRKRITNDIEQVTDNIFAIGGHRGWYYADFLWHIRGVMDKMAGGIGLRRGRTHSANLYNGDALDFWRVLVADREERRLLLYAEMKLPGEAWLEFSIREEKGEVYLQQTATFRPQGIMGRLYWYSVLPFHFFVFRGMLNRLESYGKKEEEAETPAPTA